jgi:hypothetical protein
VLCGDEDGGDGAALLDLLAGGQLALFPASEAAYTLRRD